MMGSPRRTPMMATRAPVSPRCETGVFSSSSVIRDHSALDLGGPARRAGRPERGCTNDSRLTPPHVSGNSSPHHAGSEFFPLWHSLCTFGTCLTDRSVGAQPRIGLGSVSGRNRSRFHTGVPRVTEPGTPHGGIPTGCRKVVQRCCERRCQPCCWDSARRCC